MNFPSRLLFVVAIVSLLVAGSVPAQGGLLQLVELDDIRGPIELGSAGSVRLAAGDANGDGAVDVFVAFGSGGSRLFLGDGRGDLRGISGCPLPAGLLANGAAFGDIDGDGDRDLAVAVNGQNRMLVNDGTACFDDETATRLPMAPNMTTDVAFVDCDGDGDLDCLFAQTTGLALHVNDGNGFFQDVTGANLPAIAAERIYAADVDGDLDFDLVTIAGGSARLLTNNQGSFADVTVGQTSWSGGTGIGSAALEDVDGDGDTDVVLVGSGGTGLWLNNGGSFLQPTALAGLAGADQVLLIDVDADGLVELLSSNAQGGILLENAGGGVFQTATGRGVPRLGSHSVAFDVDRDGDVDVLTADTQLRVLFDVHRQLHSVTDLAVNLPFTFRVSATPGYGMPASSAVLGVSFVEEKPGLSLGPVGIFDLSLTETVLLAPTPVSPVTGSADWTLAIPDLPVLVDVPLFAQAAVLHMAPPLGWKLTNTIERSFLPEQPRSAAGFLGPYGLQNFPQQYVAALQAFLEAEQLYEAGDYQGALGVLNGIWAQYPMGASSWASLPSQPFGINVGSPTCYYGLRMLTDMTNWRLASGAVGDSSSRKVRLTVVLPGASSGIEPASVSQLQSGLGTSVVHTLDPRVQAAGYRAVHQSLRLFNEYVLAMTGGWLGVETQILRLPNVTLPVHAQALQGGGYYAGLVNAGDIWSSVPAQVREETDWWWLVYPSHVPEQYPTFATTAFITGGMGVGPDGQSPCFIIDDRWLVRAPPHLGTGEYADEERRAYLPQWLQHEFFHHLFRAYPQFGLEATGHQWFNRSTWPPDFVGRIEPDYYHEALFKRLMSATPPLHAKLRYATAGAPWAQLATSDVLRTYQRQPVENAWHNGTISMISSNLLRWTNTAGVSWSLTPDLANGVLFTGPDCPYYNVPGGDRFNIYLARDDRGDLTAQIGGFNFLGEAYVLR